MVPVVSVPWCYFVIVLGTRSCTHKTVRFIRKSVCSESSTRARPRRSAAPQASLSLRLSSVEIRPVDKPAVASKCSRVARLLLAETLWGRWNDNGGFKRSHKLSWESSCGPERTDSNCERSSTVDKMLSSSVTCDREIVREESAAWQTWLLSSFRQLPQPPPPATTTQSPVTAISVEAAPSTPQKIMMP